jgi:hypothetical protein
VRIQMTAAAASAAWLLAGTPAIAATDYVVGYVHSVLVNADSTFGGCMARLTVDPHSKLPACGTEWVSFDCQGNRTDPVRAYRMLDQAQLALAAGKLVLVAFDDAQLFNGYCYATRIDVMR